MDETLLRAARLVVAANSRFIGVVQHHSLCATEKDDKAACDCGSDNLNEALGILAKAHFESTGKARPWYPTDEEFNAEMSEVASTLEK
jgi:hypothetical protein